MEAIRSVVTSGAVEIFEKMTEYNWILGLSFVFAFFLAFGLGANDVANSFATSVGSKVVTLKQACIIAAIAEFAGAVLLGARVSDTIQNGITDPEIFKDNPADLMLGHMCTMLATAIWLNLATRLKLPVSGTHSVVSGILGFALVFGGADAIQWWEFGKICVSWVTSPLLAGIFSVGFFMIVKHTILIKANSYEVGLMAIPLIYMLTILINTIPVVLQLFQVILTEAPSDDSSSSATEVPGGWDPEDWEVILIACSIGIFLGAVTAVCVRIWVVPYTRKFIDDKFAMGAINEDSVDKAELTTPLVGPTVTVEQQKTENLFNWLQILSATFAAFVHGANDVSNAIGPLAAVWTIWSTGEVSDEASSTEIWILVYGAVGIVLGLVLWGRYVIETVGTKLTNLSPSRGFCIENGSSVTVLIASWLGIPVSTTHCKVGAVVSVGYASNDGGVSWKMFGVIFASWVATIPFAGCISAAFFAMLRLTL